MNSDSITAKEYRDRTRGKAVRAQGELAEKLVRAELIRRGYRMVEKIHTPFRLHRKPGKGIIGATPMEKVSGDFRCVGPCGQSVLVEVKSRAVRLPYSALERHQVRALDEHWAAGGTSLLVWVESSTWTVHVFEWPVADHIFGPGKSLTMDAETK